MIHPIEATKNEKKGRTTLGVIFLRVYLFGACMCVLVHVFTYYILFFYSYLSDVPFIYYSFHPREFLQTTCLRLRQAADQGDVGAPNNNKKRRDDHRTWHILG